VERKRSRVWKEDAPESPPENPTKEEKSWFVTAYYGEICRIVL